MCFCIIGSLTCTPLPPHTPPQLWPYVSDTAGGSVSQDSMVITEGLGHALQVELVCFSYRILFSTPKDIERLFLCGYLGCKSLTLHYVGIPSSRARRGFMYFPEIKHCSLTSFPTSESPNCKNSGLQNSLLRELCCILDSFSVNIWFFRCI